MRSLATGDMKNYLGIVLLMATCTGSLHAEEKANSTLPQPRTAAPTEEIHGEEILLSSGKVSKWGGGTRLAHVQGMGLGKGLPVPNALDPRSVVVRAGDRTLNEGEDYVVNGIYGTLSLGPSPSLTSSQKVTVDYTVGFRRIDSVIRGADGSLILKEGPPHLTSPQPPELSPGEVRAGNYFMDYFIAPAQAVYLPCEESPAQANTRTVSRGLDHVLAKLKNGEPVNIVCWGDSVTAGGEASSQASQYPALFAEGLKKLFPKSPISVKVVAVGGSQSRQWLYPDKYPHPTSPQACRFDKVIASKPDVVTVEFLNDAWMPPDVVDQVYNDMLQRLHAAGAEVVLITPSFTMPEMMRASDLRTDDKRGYVDALKSFADTHHLALADASARWAHLWKEGVPYVTLLHNGINHPDDRGHAIFSEELIKCFSGTPPPERITD